MIAALSWQLPAIMLAIKKQKAVCFIKYSFNSKDSLAKPGNWLKVHFVNKINDSVLDTSYGKMPGYAQVVTR